MHGFGLTRVVTVVAVACFVLVAATAKAEKISVKLKDGRTLTGELVSRTDQKVTLKVDGVELSFDRNLVESIGAPPSDEPEAAPEAKGLTEEFKKKRAAIDDKNFAKRYSLCNEYFQLGNQSGKTPKALEAYKLALGEIEQLVKAKPDSLPYKLLRDELSKRVKELASVAENGNETNQNKSGGAIELISDEQLNLLWIYETNPDKREHRSGIRKLSLKDVKKLFEDTKYRDDPALRPFLGRSGVSRFNRLRGYQQLDILFKMRAREYYDLVEVSEPPHMKTYSTELHPRIVMKYCGSCHSAKAPRTSPEALAALTLLSKRSHPTASVKRLAYTNYMIMVESKSGPFYIIDRAAPRRSPLLEFGVPRASAQRPHPEVRGMDPYFRGGANDRNYQKIVTWMQKLYPREYPFRLTKKPAQASKTP